MPAANISSRTLQLLLALILTTTMFVDVPKSQTASDCTPWLLSFEVVSNKNIVCKAADGQMCHITVCGMSIRQLTFCTTSSIKTGSRSVRT